MMKLTRKLIFLFLFILSFSQIAYCAALAKRTKTQRRYLAKKNGVNMFKDDNVYRRQNVMTPADYERMLGPIDNSNSVINAAMDALKEHGTAIIDFIVGVISEWVPEVETILDILRGAYNAGQAIKGCLEKIVQIFNPQSNRNLEEANTVGLKRELSVEGGKTKKEICDDAKNEISRRCGLHPVQGNSDLLQQIEVAKSKRCSKEDWALFFDQDCSTIEAATGGVVEMMKKAYTIMSNVWEALSCTATQIALIPGVAQIGNSIALVITSSVLGTAASAVLGALSGGIFTGIKIAYSIIKLGMKIYETYKDYKKTGKISLVKVGQCIARAASLVKSLIGGRRRKFRKNKK
jgi:hypothetical protein